LLIEVARGLAHLRRTIVLYRRLADLVVVIHALVAIFFLFGSVGGRSEPWIGLFHFPLALWVCSAFIMGWTCPLTPLEISLRRAAGERGYEGSFVDHYIARLMGFKPDDKEVHVPTKKERNGQIIIGVWLGLVNLLVYGASWHKYHDALWPPYMKTPGPSAIQLTPNEPLNPIGNKPAMPVSSHSAQTPGAPSETVSAVPNSVAQVTAKPAFDDHERIHGTWDYVTLVDGPRDSIVFSQDEITFHVLDKTVAGTFVLDSSTQPKRIDLLFAGKPDGPDSRQGIYQFQRDLLVICLGTTAGLRPTEFQKGEQQNHILLVRPTAESKRGTIQ
jgi:uncharacterized protein (TIGR03067 family)